MDLLCIPAALELVDDYHYPTDLRGENVEVSGDPTYYGDITRGLGIMCEHSRENNWNVVLGCIQLSELVIIIVTTC